MRAVPEVYPPPPPTVQGMPGIPPVSTLARTTSGPNGANARLATEVYPRDPDNAVLWNIPPSRVPSAERLSGSEDEEMKE